MSLFYLISITCKKLKIQLYFLKNSYKLKCQNILVFHEKTNEP